MIKQSRKKRFNIFFSSILTYSVLIKLISNNSLKKATQWMALFTSDVLI